MQGSIPPNFYNQMPDLMYQEQFMTQNQYFDIHSQYDPYSFGHARMPYMKSDLLPMIDLPDILKQKLMFNYFDAKDFVGYFSKLAKDQNGSRSLQIKLDSSTPDEINLIFKEIKPELTILMKDVFGNYVIQKLIEKGSSQIKSDIVNSIFGKIKDLAFDTYGCRVVQKAIEVSSAYQKAKIIDELKTCIPDCVNNQNANHVIQKCIEFLDRSQIQEILAFFNQNVYNMSLHPYGCRVIQRILEKCIDEDVHFIRKKI